MVGDEMSISWGLGSSIPDISESLLCLAAAVATPLFEVDGCAGGLLLVVNVAEVEGG